MDTSATTRRAALATLIQQAFNDRKAASQLVCEPSSWRVIPRNVFMETSRDSRADDFIGCVKRAAYAGGERGEVSPVVWIRYARQVRDAFLASRPQVSVSHLNYRHPTSM